MSACKCIPFSLQKKSSAKDLRQYSFGWFFFENWHVFCEKDAETPPGFVFCNILAPWIWSHLRHDATAFLHRVPSYLIEISCQIKRSLLADFSACGGSLQRHLPCPPQCDPAKHFCFIGRNFLWNKKWAFSYLKNAPLFEIISITGSFVKKNYFPCSLATK